MRIIRSSDCRVMPWKNGGGLTTEIAVFPPEAGLDDFDWRISMARVESDGPFSLFPGIDRTLMLLEGQGLALSVEGQGVRHLAGPHEIAAFPADVAASARLDDGPITDLNVMTRRGTCAAEVRLLRMSGEHRLPAANTVGFVIAEGDGLSIDNGRGPVVLGRRDAVAVDPGEAVVLTAGAPCLAVVIAIRAVGSR